MELSFDRVEKNLFAKFAYLPSLIPGMKVEKTDDATIIVTDLLSSTFNIVCDVRSNNEDIDALYQEVVNIFGLKPFSWWLGPSGRPNNLGEILLAKGLVKDTTEYAMAINLEKYSAESTPEHLVALVDDIESCFDFSSVLAGFDSAAIEYYRHVATLGFDESQPYKLFVSYDKEKPVAIGSLFFTDDIAGIFDVLTSEDSRGLGYGTSVVNHLIRYAKNAGAKWGTLSASSDSGYRIYQKLGFQNLGYYECYERKAIGAIEGQ